ncbi:MAG: VPGUxxT family thioredoxin-like (seleno)protein, type 2 [Myxococcota bacterium]
MMDRTPFFTALMLIVLFLVSMQVESSAVGPRNAEQPRELGRIEWLRDYETAQARSAAESKPIFLLFQEVPGCQTCVSFGAEVLSNPLLIEAIEDEFIPLAILNNEGGDDRRVLQKFGEPAWNNPVVRFIDAQGQDLIPRRDRIWRAGEIAERMIQSLGQSDRPVPPYLTALRDELSPQKIEKATLSMGCYWAGEACLGELPGLLSSRTGDLGGREVVELRYDATRLRYEDLLAHARTSDCADGVFAHNEAQLSAATKLFGPAARLAKGKATDASRRNQKFHLKRAKTIAELELTPAQATKLNHSAWTKSDPTPHLSPRQRSTLKKAMN